MLLASVCSRIRKNSDAVPSGNEIKGLRKREVRRRNSYEVPLQTARKGQETRPTGERCVQARFELVLCVESNDNYACLKTNQNLNPVGVACRVFLLRHLQDRTDAEHLYQRPARP